MKEVITKQQVSRPQTPQSQPQQEEEDLISFDDSPNQTPDEDINEPINECMIEDDSPPRIIETDPEEENSQRYIEVIDNELQLMPKCLQALAEMQKLFAFLGNSKRLYGSCSHYVRALTVKLATRNWESNDKTFEGKKERKK